MPETVETDLKAIEISVRKEIGIKGGFVGKTEIEPIAFGLNALKVTFIWPEEKGGTDTLEKTIKGIKGVMSVNVTDVRRAMG